MRHIETNFSKFNLIKENMENDQGYTEDDLFELGAEIITDAANLMAKEGTDEWKEINNSGPSEVQDMLADFGGEEAKSISQQLTDIELQIASFPEGDEDNLYNDYNDDMY